jgi:hypothetical protein
VVSIVQVSSSMDYWVLAVLLFYQHYIVAVDPIVAVIFRLRHPSLPENVGEL